METQIKSTPRDVFTYLLVTATLYASVVSFLALVFAYVDVTFPDPLDFCYSCLLNQIRWSSSALIVVFPVFVFLFRFLRKEYLANPEKRELKVRKWLVYFTMFLAAVTIIIDLVVLIFNFYSGELTTRFFLKTLAVLAVALAVFGYYFWDLKKGSDNWRDWRKTKVIAGVVSLVVIISIGAGFFIVGSPAVQRDRRFDERRVSDLGILQSEIVNYWSNKGRLPLELADLKNDISGFAPPADPQTQAPYEYNPKGPLTFELCAVFKADSRPTQEGSRFSKPVSVEPYGEPYRNNWDHGPGRVCFERTIDPDFYKKQEKPRDA